MNKSTFYISCPINTYSGYGARSRDIVKAIIELDKYDVKIIPQRWGNTPMNFIDDNPEWKFLLNYMYLEQKLTQQPDIWCQITVPNEFQSIGKYNIGMTAGIETTIAPAEWIEGCNRMNLILGSSKHTIDVLRNSKFEKRNKQTNQVEGMIEWNKDGEILFEGADVETYKPLKTTKEITINLDGVKENFAYLFVGHWMQGQIGEDRKNVGLLVKAFFETFKNKSKQPALILKTSQVGSSYMDRENILKKIKEIKNTCKSNNLPNVYLLHGEFSNQEMNQIYNHPKVKAMVCLTKGEGFGRPLLEFSLINKPIITTNWSGHIDFLNPDFTTLLSGQMTKVHDSTANNMLLKESDWFSVDTGQVGAYLKHVFENYKDYKEKAKRQGYQSRNNFSFNKMKEKIDKVLTEKIPNFPKQVSLTLPKLKKMGVSKPVIPKLELPKLNKQKKHKQTFPNLNPA
jgi:glycosyltransferase involved in cell wall biosynthesis